MKEEEKNLDLGKIKDADLIRTREFGKFGSWVIYTVGAVCSLFHLYCLLISPIDPWFFRGMHIVFLAFLCFLLYPGWQGASKKVHFVDYILILMIIVPFVYMVINFDEWIYRVGVVPTTWDTIISLIFIVAILEMTRRTTGLALSIIATVFILYGHFGNSLPGLFYHRGYSWPRIFTYLFSLDGILGLPIFVSAAYVYIFVIFGAFLRGSGVGAYFIQFSNAIVGWARGGPAKVAIISSSLFGTVSGSSAANVVGTGSFTIPMMKNMGYKPHFAGAVEAVASTGGQIMPPVMGAGAFLMAEILGIPYVKVLVAAILPAAMYYLAVYFMVDFEAAKTGLVGLPPDQIPNKKETFKRIYMFAPLAVLVYYIAIEMASIIKAGTLAVVGCVAVSWTSKETRMGLKKVIDSLANGAKGAIEMAGTCAAAGIVIGIISQTGIGLKFATILLEYSKGILPLALFLSMVVAIVLGMGMPTTAAYAICAAVITTGLIKLGAIPIAAHLFVFYFACISAITPPVALAAYAGAAIAKASPNKVGFTAMKLGVAAFIAPYMFIFSPAMLFIGNVTDVIIVAITALLGSFALACGMQGWLWGRVVGIPIRVLLIAGAILLIKPGIYTDIAGVCILALSFFLSRFFSKKQTNIQTS
jgi:TRAP transporter 4TM/12TM fusion protein